MIVGEGVRSRPGGRVASGVFFAAAGLFCVVAVLSGEAGAAVFATLPLALGVAALASADKSVEFVVQEDGLEFTYPHNLFLPYEDMRGLSGRSLTGGSDFPIQVYHDDGVVRIPAGLSTPSGRLYKFLLDRLPWRGTPDAGRVPLALEDFLDDQVELFGADKVFVFRGRRHPPVGRWRQHVWYSAAVLAAGVLWATAGAGLEAAGKKGTAWVWLAIPLMFLGGAFVAAFRTQEQKGGRRSACLVVSPVGIALVQGPIRGTMPWAELQAIDYPAKPTFAMATAGGIGGLGLSVAGAYLIVADYYDRPLAQIKDCLREYWGGPHAN